MLNAKSNLLAEVKAAITAQYPGIRTVSVKYGPYSKINIRTRIVTSSGVKVKANCFGWSASAAIRRYGQRLSAQPELLGAALTSRAS